MTARWTAPRRARRSTSRRSTTRRWWNAGNSLAYTENQAATAIDTALTVSDVDSRRLASATVSITNGISGRGRARFNNQTGISGSYNAATGVLTLNGTATVAHYQAALESVTFSSSSQNPTDFGADTSRSSAGW